MNEPTPTSGSRAVQGCLFGAVGLFALLLIIMLLLAYQRFREETGRDTPPAPTGALHDTFTDSFGQSSATRTLSVSTTAFV